MVTVGYQKIGKFVARYCISYHWADLMEEEREEYTPQQGGVEDRKAFVNKFWNFVEGHILEKAFNGRMISWIVAIAIYAVLQVGYNYSAMRKIKMISTNNTTLQDLRMEHITLSTELMNDSRITTIEERVAEAGLTICTPKTAPIEIKE